MPVTVRDGLAAEALLAKAESGEPIDNAALIRGFMVWAEAIKRHCSREQAQAIAADIKAEPSLTALGARANQRPT